MIMKKGACVSVVAMVIISLFLGGGDAGSQTRDRSKVAEKDTWRLEDLYDSDEAWRASKDKLVTALDNVLQYKGKLATSADALFSCLYLYSDLDKEFSRLYSYASMKSDLDLRVAQNIGMEQEMDQLGTNFSSKISFIEPELVKMDRSDIDRFILERPELGVYRFYLYDIQRRKEHKLSAEEEKIIAEAGMMARGPASIYSIFTNAELPYPEVELSDGTKAKLNQAGYNRYRSAVNRRDRELVFKEFWGAMDDYRQTLGVSLYSSIKKDIFYMRVRGYDSSLHSALDVNNIPVDV